MSDDELCRCGEPECERFNAIADRMPRPSWDDWEQDVLHDEEDR